MKTLALDQSSRVTGWAIFENGSLINQGKFELTDTDLGKRLLKFKNEVRTICSEYGINEVVFEDIQLQGNVANNVSTFKILAEVFGVLELLLTELDIPYSIILASSWKSELGIKGRTRTEQKKAAQEYVLNTYNIKAIQDVCDAICIGTAHLSKSINDWSK